MGLGVVPVRSRIGLFRVDERPVVFPDVLEHVLCVVLLSHWPSPMQTGQAVEESGFRPGL